MADFDQSIKTDAGKYRPSLVPTQIIKDIAEVRAYGAGKYGDSEAWREVTIARYKDALLRHIIAMWEDTRAVDDESGIAHYKHAACNLAFIADLLEGKK